MSVSVLILILVCVLRRAVFSCGSFRCFFRSSFFPDRLFQRLSMFSLPMSQCNCSSARSSVFMSESRNVLVFDVSLLVRLLAVFFCCLLTGCVPSPTMIFFSAMFFVASKGGRLHVPLAGQRLTSLLQLVRRLSPPTRLQAGSWSGGGDFSTVVFAF